MRSIPDRWLDYKPHGKVMEIPKILAFKVPLKLTVAKNLSEGEQFTTTSLMDSFPNLKFVIDLTNTNRYYDKNDFSSKGVKHTKIMVPGKQVPPESCVLKFFKAMDTFLSTAKNDDIVGVHCTHGLNRTGYLICRYMMQQLGWDLDVALKAFEEARGHEIERKEYIEHLRSVKSAGKLDTSKIVIQPESNHRRRDNNLTKRPHGAFTNWRDHPSISELSPRSNRPGSRPKVNNRRRQHRTRWGGAPPFPPSSHPTPPRPNFPPRGHGEDIKPHPVAADSSQTKPPSSYPIRPRSNFPPRRQSNDIELRPDTADPSQSRPPSSHPIPTRPNFPPCLQSNDIKLRPDTADPSQSKPQPSYPIRPRPNFPPRRQSKDIELRPDTVNPSQSRPLHCMGPTNFRMPPPGRPPLPYGRHDPHFRGPRPPLQHFGPRANGPFGPRHRSHHWPSKNHFINGPDNLRGPNSQLPIDGRDPGASGNLDDFKNDNYSSNFVSPMIPQLRHVSPKQRKTQ